MAAKRAVQGRSLPYDEALAEFQKKKEKLGILTKRKADKDKEKDNSSSKDIKVDISVGGEGSAPVGNRNAGGGMHFPGDGGIAYPQIPVGGLANVPGGNPAPLPGSSATSHPQQQQQQRPPQTHLKANFQAQVGAGGNGTMAISSGGNAAAGALGVNGSSKPVSSSSGGINSKPASSSTSATAAQVKAGSSSKPPKSSSNAMNGQSASGPAGTSASASASASAASLQGQGSGSTSTTTTKKKSGNGEKKRTTGKSNKASKADLILGEIDDPPESTSTSTSALAAIGDTASGNTALTLEEEAPDSDDELEQLLMAVGRFSRPRPLAVHGGGLSLGNEARAGGRYQQRYRESFMTAFTGRSMTAKSAG